jgi:hypothetical protein
MWLLWWEELRGRNVVGLNRGAQCSCEVEGAQVGREEEEARCAALQLVLSIFASRGIDEDDDVVVGDCQEAAVVF